MNITIDDFELEWSHKDGIVHKADYDDLIRVYEKQESYNKEIRNMAIEEFAEKMKEVTYQWFTSGKIELGMIDEIAEQIKDELGTTKIPEVIFKQGFDEELYIDGELACVHKRLIIADVLSVLENRGIITVKIEDEMR